MLKTNKKLETISNDEIKQVLTDTLIKYEQEAIINYLNKFSNQKEIPAMFCHKNDDCDHCQFYIGEYSGMYAFASYKVINPHPMRRRSKKQKYEANATDVKQFATGYVNKITDSELFNLQRWLDLDGSSCKYQELHHKLTIWIMTNFVLFKSDPHIDISMLELDNHSDELLTYLLYCNDWNKLSSYLINDVCKELTNHIKLTNHPITTTFIKEINGILLKRTDEVVHFDYLIELALQYHVYITIPINKIINLCMVVRNFYSDDIQPMAIITRSQQDVASIINDLAQDEYIDYWDDFYDDFDEMYGYLSSDLDYLHDNSFKFKANGFEKLYKAWFDSLKACPGYENVETFVNIVNGLEIMFPELCK